MTIASPSDLPSGPSKLAIQLWRRFDYYSEVSMPTRFKAEGLESTLSRD